MKRSSGHIRTIQKKKRTKALKEFEKGYIKAYGQIPRPKDKDMFTRGFNMGFKSSERMDEPQGRLGIYSLNEVLDKVMCGECRIDFNGYTINMNRDNLKLFFRNHTCIKCGLEGQYFVMESTGDNPHFNLYALKEGKEVLMTKDHIIPKSKNGKDVMSNFQTMCITCNQEKGNKLE